MKKGLRSRIRALQCPRFNPEQDIRQDSKALQRCYAQGSDSAVRLVLEYMDRYSPLPAMLFDRVQELRAKRIDDIDGGGRPGTIVCNAGFVLACNRILKLVWEEHSDEIERGAGNQACRGDRVRLIGQRGR